MDSFVFKYRVSYADTDQMKVAYYANYLIWFERARTEFLRASGFTYKNMEKEGVFLPVSEINCQYHRSAAYDDELDIVTTLKTIGGASITFEYHIMRKKELLATGYTKHPFINTNGKPMRIPKHILEVLSKQI